MRRYKINCPVSPEYFTVSNEIFNPTWKQRYFLILLMEMGEPVTLAKYLATRSRELISAVFKRGNNIFKHYTGIDLEVIMVSCWLVMAWETTAMDTNQRIIGDRDY